MTLLAVLEKHIYSPLIVASSRALSLQRFARLALEWQLPDAQVRQALNYFGLWEAEGHLLPVMAGGATPVVMTDASTPLNAANLNKYINAETKANVKIRYGLLEFDTGTDFIVNPVADSAGMVDGDLVWGNPSANFLNITLAGFATTPIILVSNVGFGSHESSGLQGGTTSCLVVFFDHDGTLQTVPSSAFKVFVLIIGA